MAVRRSRAGQSGSYVDGIASVDVLVDQLRQVPTKAKLGVRKAIVAATREMRAEMAARASWSSRIPAAIGVRTSFAKGSVEIRVSSRAAPHARPYEGIGGSPFRHPVYGQRDQPWAEQAARPFFFPTVEANRARVRGAVEAAIFATLPR